MMGDIDLLYNPEQQKSMQSCMKSLGYQWQGENQKHDHYLRPPSIDVEMHRELLVADSEYAWYYKDIWKRCRSQPGYRYVFEMSLEDEFIFNIVHLTEHFKCGGIGIRLIMDVFVYNHLNMNYDYVRSELKKLDLLAFYNNLSALAEKWFGTQKEVSPVILELEQYVLDSNLYGKQENLAAISVAESRWNFLLKTCFPNFRRMKSAYLWLEKFPMLLPIAWIMRGWRVVFRRKETLAFQFNVFQHGDSRQGKELREFYRRCGL